MPPRPSRANISTGTHGGLTFSSRGIGRRVAADGRLGVGFVPCGGRLGPRRRPALVALGGDPRTALEATAGSDSGRAARRR